MGSQLLELKWANHKSNMALELQELYLSDALLDVTIACGEFSLKAHKTVLSASSTFFRKLFIDNPCKHPILIMTDIDFEDLKTIVQFMYKGEIHISREKLTQFLKTADRLKIKGLTSMEHMDISASEQPEIDLDLQYSSSAWEQTDTQSKQQDTPEAESACSSKKVTDSVQNNTNQGTASVKLEHDSAQSDNDDCMYWQSDCFDQTSTTVLPECSLSSPPIVSQAFTSSLSSSPVVVPSVPHQPSTHSVSHQLTVQSVSHKQSPSASHQPSESSSVHQVDDPSVSQQLGISLNSENERFTYSERQSDNRPLLQESEDVTGGEIIPGNVHQSQDQSPISIPSSSKSFEIVESLSGQSSSQGGKPGKEAFTYLKEPCDTLQTVIHSSQVGINKVSVHGRGSLSTFNCNFCNKSFISHTALKKHTRIHSQPNSFTYTDNSFPFQGIDPLHSSSKVHSGEKLFRCEIYNKQLPKTNLLKSHRREHTGEKPFSCKVCKKTFSRTGNLRMHEMIHSGEKPFLCGFCGKKFRQKATLNNHLRLHTGEKPFSCISCGKKFRQLAALSKHHILHTGQNPFWCKVCGKQFPIKGNLKQHEKVHARVKN